MNEAEKSPLNPESFRTQPNRSSREIAKDILEHPLYKGPLGDMHVRITLEDLADEFAARNTKIESTLALNRKMGIAIPDKEEIVSTLSTHFKNFKQLSDSIRNFRDGAMILDFGNIEKTTAGIPTDKELIANAPTIIADVVSVLEDENIKFQNRHGLNRTEEAVSEYRMRADIIDNLSTKILPEIQQLASSLKIKMQSSNPLGVSDRGAF